MNKNFVRKILKKCRTNINNIKINVEIRNKIRGEIYKSQDINDSMKIEKKNKCRTEKEIS